MVTKLLSEDISLNNSGLFWRKEMRNWGKIECPNSTPLYFKDRLKKIQLTTSLKNQKSFPTTLQKSTIVVMLHNCCVVGKWDTDLFTSARIKSVDCPGYRCLFRKKAYKMLSDLSTSLYSDLSTQERLYSIIN